MRLPTQAKNEWFGCFQTTFLYLRLPMDSPETLSRQEIIQQMSQRVDGLTQKAAAAALDAAVEVMLEALGSGRSVRLSGFGSFQLRRRKARTNIHPRTSLPVEVPAAWNAVFVPSQALRDRLRTIAVEPPSLG